MDWPLAIDKNREKLINIIVALMASLGLTDGGKLTTLPFYLYRKALLILRPAEAAVRRLIMMAVYEMELRCRLSTTREAPIPKAHPKFQTSLRQPKARILQITRRLVSRRYGGRVLVQYSSQTNDAFPGAG